MFTTGLLVGALVGEVARVVEAMVAVHTAQLVVGDARGRAARVTATFCAGVAGGAYYGKKRIVVKFILFILK